MSKKGEILYCIWDWMWYFESDLRLLTGLDSLMSEMRLFYLKKTPEIYGSVRDTINDWESESIDYVRYQ